MLTPDDLTKIAELLKQIEARFDEKLKNQTELFNEKLDKQTQEILQGAADYISEAIIPILEKHEKRLEQIEQHSQHPPGQAANT
jgi:Mg2+ and Co2+ transporter CorA